MIRIILALDRGENSSFCVWVASAPACRGSKPQNRWFLTLPVAAWDWLPIRFRASSSRSIHVSHGGPDDFIRRRQPGQHLANPVFAQGAHTHFPGTIAQD